jgi:hypothetical protein
VPQRIQRKIDFDRLLHAGAKFALLRRFFIKIAIRSTPLRFRSKLNPLCWAFIWLRDKFEQKTGLSAIAEGETRSACLSFCVFSRLPGGDGGHVFP